MTSDQLANLSLTEQVSLTSGGTAWSTSAVRDPVRGLNLSDGPHGLRRTQDGAVTDAEGGVVATGTAPVAIGPGQQTTARQRRYVREPALWSPDEPTLHTVTVTLDDDEDVERVTFGIRSLQLDPDHGLRLNGAPVKLRGACVHHDNGPLGAATYARAEERRVQLLKDAGFNAIRMSHTP